MKTLNGNESGNGESSDGQATNQIRTTAQAPTVRKFNTETLIVAREMAGFTQAELARNSGLSQSKISRFEDGISEPSEQEIFVLASYLKLPTRFFSRTDIKRSVFNSFYRKRKSVSQKVLMQFNSRVCFRQVQIDRLLSKVELDTTPIPRFEPSEYKGGTKQVAGALRQLLKLPPGPIKELVPVLEDAGVIIVLEDFGVTKIDGVSTFTNNGCPIIFLNKSAPNSRRRFSLAHEFAHTALHRYVAPDADEQADELAREFLMPEDDIFPELTIEPLTIARLANLKLRWRVSMAAILYQARALNAIDERRYANLWRKMSFEGYKIREPYEDQLTEEKPSFERDIVQFHRNDLQYSVAELAESLDITEAEVIRRYEMPMDLKVI